MRRLCAPVFFCPALLLSGPAFATAAPAEAKSGPESITAAPDGGVILGSATSPRIFRAAKGETQAKVFIDASASGATMFLGVLADGPSNTPWACQLQAVPGTPNPKSPFPRFD